MDHVSQDELEEWVARVADLGEGPDSPALRRAARSPDHAFALACALYEEGALRPAFRWFRLAASAPGAPTAATVGMIDILLDSGHLPAARGLLDRVFREDSYDGLVYRAAARTACAAGEIARECALRERVYHAEQTAETGERLLLTYLELERYDEARRVLDTMPDTPRRTGLYGLLSLRKGAAGAAARQFQDAVQAGEDWAAPYLAEAAFTAGDGYLLRQISGGATTGVHPLLDMAAAFLSRDYEGTVTIAQPFVTELFRAALLAAQAAVLGRLEGIARELIEECRRHVKAQTAVSSVRALDAAWLRSVKRLDHELWLLQTGARVMSGETLTATERARLQHSPCWNTHFRRLLGESLPPAPPDTAVERQGRRHGIRVYGTVITAVITLLLVLFLIYVLFFYVDL